MKGIVLSFTICLFLFANAGSSTLSPSRTGQRNSVRLRRNLAHYDRFGPYRVPIDGESLRAIPAEARGFIWEHWVNHRLAKVIVTFRSLEGEPSTSEMFVEPDDAGVWHLSTTIERKLIDRRAFSDPKFKGTIEQTDKYEAYIIERIEVPSNGLSERIVISPDLKRGPESYVLRFRDKEGRVITEF